MKAMTLVVTWFALSAVPLKLRALSVQEATTKRGSLYAGASREVTEWTVVAFEGAPPIEAMRTDGSEPMLFVDDWPCSLVWRGSKGWCVVPRVKDPSAARLWGPVRLAPGGRPDAAKVARLRKGAEAQGAKLSDAKAGAVASSETLDDLLEAVASSPTP